MTKILKKMPPVEGVVPGEKATEDLPIGPRYYKFEIDATVKPDAGSVATVDDILGTIKLTVNGKTQREFTALELQALNVLNGAEFATKVFNITNPGNPLANGDTAKFRLPILLGEPFRKSYSAGEVMAWPTKWTNGATLGTFQIEFSIPDVTGYTLHDVKVYASIDSGLGSVDASGNPIFNISKWYRETIIYTAAGERYVVTLPKRDQYQQMNFFTQTGDPISHIKIKRDGEEILDVDKDVNDTDLERFGLNAAGISADRLDVVFDRDDLPDSALPMNGVREFEVILTLAAAAAANKSITLVRQAYGPRD